ncbi:hypothetical protein CYMTET_44885 [Cymbomonas tetramitiformis]|uniref:Uncharacterized protein n=1 Tax=Cymbomonas tetramitiformis TaxID=36881 RepID=A0AAE0C159_9CHLO|nr:hypothetical protein CYMTET_44885 [Cymbomonas tetramitiformis]
MFEPLHEGFHQSFGYGGKGLGSFEGTSSQYPTLEKKRSKELEAEFLKYFLPDAFENQPSQPHGKLGSSTPEDPKGPLDFELSD